MLVVVLVVLVVVTLGPWVPKGIVIIHVRRPASGVRLSAAAAVKHENSYYLFLERAFRVRFFAKVPLRWRAGFYRIFFWPRPFLAPLIWANLGVIGAKMVKNGQKRS